MSAVSHYLIYYESRTVTTMKLKTMIALSVFHLLATLVLFFVFEFYFRSCPTVNCTSQYFNLNKKGVGSVLEENLQRSISNSRFICFVTGMLHQSSDLINRFQYLTEYCHVIMFLSGSSRLESFQYDGVIVVKLPEEDFYPPRKIEIATMRMLSDVVRRFSALQGVLRLDADTVVSPDYFAFLRSFQPFQTSNIIIGIPAFGRSEDKNKLGLPPGVPYCMGGPSVMYGADILRSVSHSKWSLCYARPVSNHSDTEVQRCIYEATHASCMNRTTIETKALVRRQLAQFYKKDALVQFVSSNATNYWVVHPVKERHHFVRVRTMMFAAAGTPRTAIF